MPPSAFMHIKFKFFVKSIKLNIIFFVLLLWYFHKVVATVAGPKSVIKMELYKSNITEEIEKFVFHIF